MTTEDFTDNIYYEIFINKNGNNYRYYLSSRSVLVNSTYVFFCINAVSTGKVAPDDISHSDGAGEQDSSSYFRPVITLDSNVITTEGDGQSVGTAYQISI